MLWTFPTYSMPDVAFFNYILTISSCVKARESGNISMDATSLDGYVPFVKIFAEIDVGQ